MKFRITRVLFICLLVSYSSLGVFAQGESSTTGDPESTNSTDISPTSTETPTTVSSTEIASDPTDGNTTESSTTITSEATTLASDPTDSTTGSIFTEPSLEASTTEKITDEPSSSTTTISESTTESDGNETSTLPPSTEEPSTNSTNDPITEIDLTTLEPLVPPKEGGAPTWAVVTISILISFALIFTGLYFLRKFLIKRRRDDQRRLLRGSVSSEGFFYGDGSGATQSNRFHDSI